LRNSIEELEYRQFRVVNIDIEKRLSKYNFDPREIPYQGISSSSRMKDVQGENNDQNQQISQYV